MSDYVTILGSCRQQSIKNYLPVSTIQEGLNYPHYSKEVLQQIKYLKYRNLSDTQASYCFRSGILSRDKGYVNDNIYNHFKNEFERTTLFIIEIASRISYKWNDIYVHSEAKVEANNFYERENIIETDLTDEEIEDDIINIQKELYPKKILIVSHFATYETGKRYELIKLLENICSKCNIPFLDPSVLIKEHGVQILHDERVLAHYTPDGEVLAGNFLFEKIKQINEEAHKNKIYQVYYLNSKQSNYYGFGDYIRGSIFSYQVLKNKNVELKINFSNHYLGDIFYCDNHLSIDECNNVLYDLTGKKLLENSNVNNNNLSDYKLCMFTHNFPLSNNIDDDCKNFIKQKCLTPRIHFEKKLINLKKSLGLLEDDYIIIHVRTQENLYLVNPIFNHSLDIVNKIVNENPNKKIVLLASDNEYLNGIHIRFPFLIKTNLQRGHTGLSNASLKDIEGTMLEFMLMTTSKKIYQLTTMWWGSGFSDSINRIYDIEVERYLINV